MPPRAFNSRKPRGKLHLVPSRGHRMDDFVSNIKHKCQSSLPASCFTSSLGLMRKNSRPLSRNLTGFSQRGSDNNPRIQVPHQCSFSAAPRWSRPQLAQERACKEAGFLAKAQLSRGKASLFGHGRQRGIHTCKQGQSRFTSPRRSRGPFTTLQFIKKFQGVL